MALEYFLQHMNTIPADSRKSLAIVSPQWESLNFTGRNQAIIIFSLHINDITADMESEIRPFADDCVCYREIKDIPR